MITVKPSLGPRIFWGAASFSLFVTACAGLAAFPVGLILTCLGIPLGILALLYTLGVPQTQFDQAGITQRNLILMTKKIAWQAVEGVEFFSYTHRSKDEQGWERRTDWVGVEILGGGMKFRVETKASNPAEWWPQVRDLVREKVPAERIHTR
ncbi:MAG TPA: hypothetical protein PK530_23265 [Anaerolineales bacterium]|nr:hypothetical protein [Anaerolineales bacterium]